MQYLRLELFDQQIQESRFYVMLYNGVCYKLLGETWREVALDGSEDFFSRAYLSLPYEQDANTFAYEKVKEICGDTPQLQELYNFWIPGKKLEHTELQNLFERIDRKN